MKYSKIGKRLEKPFKGANNSWFELDKLEHFICYFILGIWFYCIWWLGGITKTSSAILSVITCFVVGLLIEALQTTWFWAKIMRFIGEDDTPADNIDKKDIVVNIFGGVIGVITILFIQSLC